MIFDIDNVLAFVRRTLNPTNALKLADWIEEVGAEVAAAELRSQFGEQCRWTGCLEKRVNKVWCAEHRERANADGRARAERCLKEGRCRRCEEFRAGPSERYPEGDPTYCPKHREATDKSNVRSKAKKRRAA